MKSKSSEEKKMTARLHSPRCAQSCAHREGGGGEEEEGGGGYNGPGPEGVYILFGGNISGDGEGGVWDGGGGGGGEEWGSGKGKLMCNLIIISPVADNFGCTDNKMCLKCVFNSTLFHLLFLYCMYQKQLRIEQF